MVTNPYAGIKDIKTYALDNNIPIMQDEGIDFLTEYIAKNNITKVLEIGTAIGYSAIMMALSNPNVTITSIERNRDVYLEAVKNIKKMGLEKRITLIFQDALEVHLEETFDLIFIDAAKAQSIHFFERFEKNLANNGTIITDNIYFHGLVDAEEETIASKNLRSLVRKIKQYIKFLEENKAYQTEILRIGDGISVSRKKERAI